MTRDQAAQEVRARYTEYLTRCKDLRGKPTFICPRCRNQAGKNGGIHSNGVGHLELNTKPGAAPNTFHCFSCGWSGDVIDAYQEEHGGTTREAFNALYSFFGLEIDGKEDKTRPAIRPAVQPAAPEPEPDFTAFYKEAAAHLGETDYYKRRGISEATARRFNLGYVAEWRSPKAPTAPPSPRLIIPITGSSYIARDTRQNVPERAQPYKKMQAGHKAIFNRAALQEGGPCFITEGEIDALSIVEVGRPAAALSSVSMVDKFLKVLDETPPAGPLVLCLDNDEAGQGAIPNLEAGLKDRGLQYIKADISGGHKDPNEALTADRAAFTAAVERAYTEATEAVEDQAADDEARRAEYMNNSAGARVQDFINRIQQNRPCIPTGWAKLDETLDGGLYTGLYVLGAISSLGKTTLGIQLIDNIVAAGNDAIIFSLEMSADEIMAKSISRLTLEIALASDDQGGIRNAKTTRGILDHARYKGYSSAEQRIIREAIETYKQRTQGHLWILEGIGDIGTEKIRLAVQDHITLTGRKPVIFVDYLQILAPASDRLTDKQAVDKNILELKRISRDFDIPVIAVSSLNRKNYLEPISMEALKESGGIEYSSDCVLGLQYSGLDYMDGETDGARVKRIRELIKANEGRATEGQEIQLKILKNRNGARGQDEVFKFYPLFNLFREQ